MDAYDPPDSPKRASRRPTLKRDPRTNCYREVNSAADGHPGWIVDRYDTHLLVQQRLPATAKATASSPMPPLPSIHDGFTKGIYLLRTAQDSSSSKNKPTLLQGQPLPP